MHMLSSLVDVYRYKSRHQIQFFGRGHVAGIDIKVMSNRAV